MTKFNKIKNLILKKKVIYFFLIFFEIIELEL